MRHRAWRLLAILPLAGALLLQAGSVATRASTGDDGGDLNDLNMIQTRLVSGFASYELNNKNLTSGSNQSANYSPRGSDSCAVNTSSNIKINQNCLNLTDPDLMGRGQAQNETSIAEDPNNPNHMVASYNDYRRGDGNCFTAYSTNSGRTWNDSAVPMSFTRGPANGNYAREYWQAGGDTSVAWDTKGNAYLMCQVFNRGYGASSSQDVSSALLVFRSTQNNGASWNFPGRYASFDEDLTGTEGNIVLLDKPYLTVDNNVGSPYQDRVYVTWTQFATNGSAYIYEAYSSDYGETFSAPVLVGNAGDTTGICPITYGVDTAQGNCNENQYSEPFTGPDGNLYVVWSNFNNGLATAQDNENQMLLAKSTDGGQTFGPAVKVGNYYDLPDCATYQGGQDAGRSCVPEKGPTNNSVFRAVNYPTGAVNPTNPNQIVVTYGSYINKDSNESNGCVPTGFSPFGLNTYTGVKTPGACNNDILESVSNDGGATFTGTTTDPRAMPTVNSDPGQATTDQFWQWEAFAKNGKLAVSYYDREYGTDETTGYSDVSLSGTGDLANFVVNRVTSSSMPFPTEFPGGGIGGLFYGDYTGLTAYVNAYPAWMDTRNPELFDCPLVGVGSAPAACTANYGTGTPTLNDQDAYTAALPIPSK